MKRTCLRDDEIRAIKFEDEDGSGGNDESYIPSDDDSEVHMILSDPECSYVSSSDRENVAFCCCMYSEIT